MMCISAYHGIAANWYLLSCLGSGVRVDAERGLAPRIYEGGGTSAHTGVGISIEFQAVYRHTYRSFAPFP